MPVRQCVCDSACLDFKSSYTGAEKPLFVKENQRHSAQLTRMPVKFDHIKCTAQRSYSSSHVTPLAFCEVNLERLQRYCRLLAFERQVVEGLNEIFWWRKFCYSLITKIITLRQLTKKGE